MRVFGTAVEHLQRQTELGTVMATGGQHPFQTVHDDDHKHVQGICVLQALVPEGRADGPAISL